MTESKKFSRAGARRAGRLNAVPKGKGVARAASRIRGMFAASIDIGEMRKMSRKRPKGMPKARGSRAGYGGGGDPDLMGVKRPRGLPKGVRRKVM